MNKYDVIVACTLDVSILPGQIYIVFTLKEMVKQPATHTNVQGTVVYMVADMYKVLTNGSLRLYV